MRLNIAVVQFCIQQDSSQITVPFKGALTLLDHNREAMFIQEVDTAILADAEKSYEIRQDLQGRISTSATWQRVTQGM